MGAPSSGIKSAEPAAAVSLSGIFKTIDAAELRKHEAVVDYWTSIRGDREYPALHDLDPLEISEAGPSSLLLELLSGGEDAEIRHCGEMLQSQMGVDRIAEAPRPSIASCIGKKLSLVAISRNFLAFEDEFTADGAKTRCWITLLPLSAAGAWVDYVYALISFKTVEGETAETTDAVVEEPEQVEAMVVQEELAEVPEPVAVVEEPEAPEPVAVAEESEAPEPAEEAVEVPEPSVDESLAPKSVAGSAKAGPGFSKLLEDLASLGGFYKTHADKAGLTFPDEPTADEQSLELEQEQQADEPIAVEPEEAVASEPIEEPVEEPAAVEEPVEDVAPEGAEEFVAAEEASMASTSESPEQPGPVMEGTLQTKLADVRAKADEARMAKLRANSALYEGLSAAYDFALDAENAPEEYLKLVESQGLKIQLRSPMKPVVKLAFEGMCDDSTISQLETVLAWALKQELPRGSLVEQIEQAGGIGRILSGDARAA